MKITSEDDIRNLKNAKDIEKNFQISRWFLKPLGVWPIKSSSDSRIEKFILLSITLILLFFVTVPSFLSLIYEVEDIKVIFYMFLFITHIV